MVPDYVARTGLTWSLHTLDGAQIGVLEGVLPGSWVDVEGQGRRSAQITLSTADPYANDVYPYGVVLRVWQDGYPAFAGALQQPTFRMADGQIDVPALGPRARLEAFQVGLRGAGEAFAGNAGPDTPYRWEGVPQGEILRRLVEYADPTSQEQLAGIPRHGIVPGTIIPGVPRDREYEPGKQIAEAMDELGNVDGGPDWDLQPVWRPDQPWILARLDVLDEAGTDLTRTVALEFNVGKETAEDLRFMPGGDTGGPAINRMLGVGEAPPYDGEATDAPAPPAFLGNQIDSQLTFGIYTRYEGLSGVADPETVAGKVAGVLSTGAFPVDHFEVVPRPDAIDFSPIGDLWIGDHFTARGQRDAVILDLQGRAVGAKVETTETGGVKTTIRAAPRPNAAVTS